MKPQAVGKLTTSISEEPNKHMLYLPESLWKASMESTNILHSIDNIVGL